MSWVMRWSCCLREVVAKHSMTDKERYTYAHAYITCSTMNSFPDVNILYIRTYMLPSSCLYLPSALACHTHHMHYISCLPCTQWCCRSSLLNCDNWQIDLYEHKHSRIKQSIATDCRTFRPRRPSSTAYKIPLCSIVSNPYQPHSPSPFPPRMTSTYRISPSKHSECPGSCSQWRPQGCAGVEGGGKSGGECTLSDLCGTWVCCWRPGVT